MLTFKLTVILFSVSTAYTFSCYNSSLVIGDYGSFVNYSSPLQCPNGTLELCIVLKQSKDNSISESINFGRCLDNPFLTYLVEEYNLDIDSAFSYFYTTLHDVIVRLDSCSNELCNNGESLALSSQSKCEQSIESDHASQIVYPFSMSIYDHKVEQCLFCQNCSLSENGEIRNCTDNKNVCQFTLDYNSNGKTVWTGDCALIDSDFPYFQSFKTKTSTRKTIQCGKSNCNVPINFSSLNDTILCNNGFLLASSHSSDPSTPLSSAMPSSASIYSKTYIKIIILVTWFLLLNVFW